MAESLGKAWKDLNDLLEQRRQILQKNYTTQGHIQVKVVTHKVINKAIISLGKNCLNTIKFSIFNSLLKKMLSENYFKKN